MDGDGTETWSIANHRILSNANMSKKCTFFRCAGNHGLRTWNPWCIVPILDIIKMDTPNHTVIAPTTTDKKFECCSVETTGSKLN